MKNITNYDCVIWNNTLMTPTQLYLKKNIISRKTFELLNCSKYFSEVSNKDLNWAIRKNFLLFVKSYELYVFTNNFTSINEINIFTVFTTLKRLIVFFL